jgi:stalled ribosome rescue protein Dom34
MSDKKLAGLWIDQTKAVVVKNHNDFEVTEWKVSDTIKADVQHGNSNENAANNAEKTNRIKFYKEIEKAITNSVDLYVTGPGIAQEELRNYLLDTPQYKNLKITLGTSTDSNPDAVLNEVKAYYNA